MPSQFHMSLIIKSCFHMKLQASGHQHRNVTIGANEKKGITQPIPFF